MSDIDPKAVALARKNVAANGVDGITILQSDGFKTLRETDFTQIIVNPPYHADFSVPKHFIEKGFNRLRIGGRMVMVTKREGWYKNKLAAIFGGVRVTPREGYFIFHAEKRRAMYYKNCGR
jgi:16S rRNA (guanine1207-N2)-methyltransferase